MQSSNAAELSMAIFEANNTLKTSQVPRPNDIVGEVEDTSKNIDVRRETLTAVGNLNSAELPGFLG